MKNLKKIKEKIRIKIAKLKEKIQENYNHFLPRKKFFTKPKPTPKNQLESASKEKIKGFYGKIDDQEAASRFGAKNLEEFSFWAWRSCGIVCLQMILKNNQKTMDIIKEVVAKNGYIFKDDIGWKHKALVEILKKNNFKAKSLKFLATFDIASNIKKNRYVILSIKSKTGGHMIVLFGFETERNAKIKNFFYYDPLRLDSKMMAISPLKLKKLSKNQGLLVWTTKN